MLMSRKGKANKKKAGIEFAFRAGVWYTLSSLIVKAIGIISTPIYTRLLSPEEYGVASTFFSWYTLLITICSLDLVISIGRAKHDFPNKLKEYTTSLQVLSFFATLGLIIIGIIFFKPLVKIMELNPIVLAILMVYLLFGPTILFNQARFRYEYRYKENIFILFFTAISTVILSIIFISLFDDRGYIGIALGTAVPTIILAVFLWIKALKTKSININKEFWKYGLVISIPMLIHTLSFNLLSQSDIILINKISGAESAGIYSLAYRYSTLIAIVITAINQAWQPWFHDKYFVGDYKEIRKQTKKLTILGCFIGICCVAIAPEAIKVLGPQSYSVGVWVVPPVVIGIICQFLYGNYINIEIHLKNTKFASIGTLMAALLNVGLNLIFIPKYGYIAAAYSTLLCFVFLLGIHLIITRYLLKVKLYDEKFMVVSLILTIVCIYIFTLLYTYLFLRLVVLLIIILLFCILNKDLLLRFLKNKKLF